MTFTASTSFLLLASSTTVIVCVDFSLWKMTEYHLSFSKGCLVCESSTSSSASDPGGRMSSRTRLGDDACGEYISRKETAVAPDLASGPLGMGQPRPSTTSCWLCELHPPRVMTRPTTARGVRPILSIEVLL